MRPKSLLILSDKKPGHLNQSIAYARTLNADYDVVEIGFKYKLTKVFTYLLDHMGVYFSKYVNMSLPEKKYDAIVSAGSDTYYANKYLSQKLGSSSVAMMYPSGYRLNFTLIFAQQHDKPPKSDNIIEIPVNFSHLVAGDVFKPQQDKKYVGIVIGGGNRVFQMDTQAIAQYIEQIFSLFPEHEVVVTTSRRTSVDIEQLLHRYPFSYKLIYSHNPCNPVPDFLTHCDYVFITQDSTSMISEAVSNGRANVEVLPLKSRKKDSKFHRLGQFLEKQNYLHTFDGVLGNAGRKIEFYQYI